MSCLHNVSSQLSLSGLEVLPASRQSVVDATSYHDDRRSSSSSGVKSSKKWTGCCRCRATKTTHTATGNGQAVVEGSYKVKPIDVEVNHHSNLTPDGGLTGSEVIGDVNRFHRKKHEGTIDVWWMYDEGGLTLLIPHLISTKKRWKNSKMRVFMAGTTELDGKHSHMATLLRKFRIEFSEMQAITDVAKKPSQDSIEEFDRLVSKWVLKDDETLATHPWKITQAELQSQTEKTYRQIRMRELLHEHSMGATLIVVTLPMPRKGQCSAGLYMAWLDTLSYDMPPIMLLRGNQESVLTYYS